MKKAKGKKMVVLLLAVIISCITVQPVFAEQTVYDDHEKKEEVDKPEERERKFDETSVISSGEEKSEEMALLEDSDKDIPKVKTSEITWEGGLLEIPIEANSDDVRPSLLTVTSEDYKQAFSCTTYENSKALFSVLLGYNACDARQILTKAGEYDAEVSFYSEKDPYVSYPVSKFKLKVESDSQMWSVTRKTAKFDGSQNLMFSLKNGTNYYEIESISSIELFAVKSESDKGVNPVLTEGFTVNMDAGTLSIDGNAVKNALLDKKTLIEDERKKIPQISPLPINVYVNVYVKTSGGETVCFNRIHSTESPWITEPAWVLDLEKFNWLPETSGDINNDGSVDVFDLMMCLNHVAGKTKLEGAAFTAANVVKDDVVDLYDLMKILNHIAKGSAL